MSLNHEEIAEIYKVVNQALDVAEEHWENGGYLLKESVESRDSLAVLSKAENRPSRLPGRPTVDDDETVIDSYIAYVADLRDSSKHLMCGLSSKVSDVSGIQRVFYETSALLPALERTVEFQGGQVTEYLGDGLLGFFRVDDGDIRPAISAAFESAQNSISGSRAIVNKVIKERFNLPNLNIGVGLAYSKTIVSLVGLPGQKHPKAFGQSVFRANKLSGGTNEIRVDEYLQTSWPSSPGGKLRFTHKHFNGVTGYIVGREP